MSKYFSIEGYWKDDKSEFEGFIVKEYDKEYRENWTELDWEETLDEFITKND
jgi:hypothetical protein